MGRGKSKAGASNATIQTASGTLPTPTNDVILPTPEEVAKGNILPEGGVPFADFENMTDDEKAQVILDALNTGVPQFLDDSGIQRFAYFTGMAGTPRVVTDAQLDQIQGHELFRTVNDAYNPKTDIGYTSKDIAQQITDGDFTMYSDSGGSVHGKAIYFTSDYDSSAVYGEVGKNPMTMRAKVTGGKAIHEQSLNQIYSKAYNNGDKLAKACSRAGSDSARNLYALAKGYDIITTSNYCMVVNRRCLTVSSTVKPTIMGRRGSW